MSLEQIITKESFFRRVKKNLTQTIQKAILVTTIIFTATTTLFTSCTRPLKLGNSENTTQTKQIRKPIKGEIYEKFYKSIIKDLEKDLQQQKQEGLHSKFTQDLLIEYYQELIRVYSVEKKFYSAAEIYEKMGDLLKKEREDEKAIKNYEKAINNYKKAMELQKKTDRKYMMPLIIDLQEKIKKTKQETPKR